MVLSQISIVAIVAAAMAPNAAQPLRIEQTLAINEPVNAVSWNSSGTRLAVMAGFGGKINIFKASSWQLETSFNPTLGGYSENSLAFLDAETLVTTGHLPVAPETLLAWDAFAAKEERPFLTPSDPKAHGRAYAFAVSKDGQSVAAITYDRQSSAEVFDGHSGKLLWAIPGPPLSNFVAVAFAHSGRELALSTNQGELWIVEPRSGSVLRKLKVHDASSETICSAIAFSPDDNLIVAGRGKRFNRREDNLISADIINSKTGAHEAELPGILFSLGSVRETSKVSSVDWSPSGNLVAIGDGASLRVWNVLGDKPTLIKEEKGPQGTYSLQFSMNGSLAAVVGREVRIYH